MDVRRKGRTAEPVGDLIREMIKFDVTIPVKHVLPPLPLVVVPPRFRIGDAVTIILPFPIALDDFIGRTDRDGRSFNGHGTRDISRISIRCDMLRSPRIRRMLRNITVPVAGKAIRAGVVGIAGIGGQGGGLEDR